MAGPRRNVAPTNTLLALLSLAAPAACSFNAAGLGQSEESGQGSSEGSGSGGATTGSPTTTTTPTTGLTGTDTGGTGPGESSESGTDGSSSGAIDPDTGSSTTGGTSTTDVSTTTGGPDSTTGDGTSTGSCTEMPFFADEDGDGFGVPGETVMACEAPDGYAATDDDCDDEDEVVNPGADETCDGKDNDCDELTDEFTPITNLDCGGCKMALYESTVYHFCGTAERWDDAKIACEARDAMLVDDEDMAEHDWLVDQLPAASGPWLIGGRAPGGDDMFEWLDGTPVPHPDPRWGLMRPAPGGGTDYMAIVSDGNLLPWGGFNGQWYDRAGNDKEPYICESPLP